MMSFDPSQAVHHGKRSLSRRLTGPFGPERSAVDEVTLRFGHSRPFNPQMPHIQAGSARMIATTELIERMAEHAHDGVEILCRAFR